MSAAVTVAPVELLRRPGERRPGRAGADDVARALEDVVDPCSLAQGTPLSLPAMGLVRRQVLDDAGVLTVDVCVTAPGCAYVGLFADAAATRLAGLPGVAEVVVRLDPSVLWSERMLRPDASAALGAARTAGRPAPPRRAAP